MSISIGSAVPAVFNQALAALSGSDAVAGPSQPSTGELTPAPSFATQPPSDPETLFAQDAETLPTEEERQQARLAQSFVAAFNDPNVQVDIMEDEATGRFVYRSIDRDSGEVLRQFPREDVLMAVQSLRNAEATVLDTRV
ncbi:MAG: flagellar protein FlaG [Maricaulaceae bacterium]